MSDIPRFVVAVTTRAGEPPYVVIDRLTSTRVVAVWGNRDLWDEEAALAEAKLRAERFADMLEREEVSA